MPADSFYNGTGGIFTRCGKWIKAMTTHSDYIVGSAADSLNTVINDALATYDGANNDIRSTTEDVLPEFQAMKDSSQIIASFIAAAQNTLIEMIDQEDPINGERTVEDAFRDLVAFMEADGKTVEENAPTLAIVEDSNNAGESKFFGTILDGAGAILDNVYAEELILEVNDALVIGSEGAVITGDRNLASSFDDPDWPSGSGASVALSIQDPATTGFLTNGNWEGWDDATTPQNWTVTTGTLNQETTTVHRESNSLRITGTVTFEQDLTTELDPQVHYSCFLALRASAALTGTLRIELTDGSGVVTTDKAGNNNRLDIDLSTVSTSEFEAFHAFFRLSSPKPSATKIKVTTPVTISGGNLYLDDLHFGSEAQRAYEPGGPYFNWFRWSTEAGLGDKFTATVTNAYGGLLQTGCARLFGQLDTPLPSSGTPNISDTLAS